MTTKLKEFIEIYPHEGKYRVRINTSYVTKEEPNGMISCYLKSFDLYFSVKSKEESNKRALAMLNAFIKHYAVDDKKKTGEVKSGTGIGRFVLELFKRGFAVDQVLLKKLLKDHHSLNKSKFNYYDSIPNPEGFTQSEFITEEMEILD